MARDTEPGLWRMIVILGTIIAIGPLTIDMYLPALPSISEDLRASTTSVQLTLTGTLLGLALGQLFIGPISDAVGRRRPLLYGVALHIVASLLCLVAPNIAVLGLLRVVQGLGLAATGVVANAIVRDLYSGVTAAKVFSRLMLIMGVAPIVAPTLGAQVLRLTQWRGVFGVLAVLGVAIGVIAVTMLPETLPLSRRVRGGVRATLHGYGDVLRDRSFVGLVVVTGLSMAALFSYVAGSSFVMQGEYGLSQQQFGLVFSLGAAGFIAGSQFNVYLLGRYSPRQILVGALALGLVGGLALILTSAAGLGLIGVLIPLWLVLAGTGLAVPNAPAMALSRHGEMAGTAAAVLGAVQFAVGAAAAPLVGALGSTSLAMGAVVAVSIAAALAVMLTVVRPADIDNLDEPAEAALAHV